MLLLLLPWAGAALLAALPLGSRAPWLHAALLAALPVLAILAEGAEPLGRFFLALSALVALAALAGARPAFPGPRRERAWHALVQAFMGAQGLALLADDPGLRWLALGAAALAGVALVGLRGTPAALLAAWRMGLVCAAGLALSLVGTAVLHLASVTGTGLLPGFALLALGHGALAGLAPMQGWLAPAGRGAGPGAALLVTALLPLAALLALARAAAAVAAHPAGVEPGGMLLALGLLSLAAAVPAWRRAPSAASGLLGSGLAACAFGLGGVEAAQAGLLLLASTPLLRGAATLGEGARRPALAALAGLPPFMPFLAGVLLLGEAAARGPWLLLPFLLLLVAAAASGLAALRRVPESAPAEGWRATPSWLLLAGALGLALAMPPPLAALLRRAAEGLA